MNDTGRSCAVPFAVVSSQRSGSTWLVDLLNSHPSVVCYSELFLAEGAGVPKFGGAKDLPFFADWQRDTGLGVGRFLDQVYRRRSDCHAAGLKVMYGQLGAFSGMLDDWSVRRVRVVHLLRANYLDIVISMELAEARQVWHARRGRLERPTVRLNSGELLTRFDSMESQSARWRTRMKSVGLPLCEVEYASLAESPAEIRRVLGFLDVETNADLSSSLRKLRSRDRWAVVENESSVRAALSQSRYSWMLDAPEVAL